MGCSASVVLLLRSVSGADCGHMCSRRDQMSVDAATPTLEGYTATSPLTILVMVTPLNPQWLHTDYLDDHLTTSIIAKCWVLCAAEATLQLQRRVKPNSVPFPLCLLPTVMNDGCLGSGCFPSQLRGRKKEMEGGEKWGGGGGQTGGICFLWEKNPLSLHMALSDDDKYSESSVAVSDVTDESGFFSTGFPPPDRRSVRRKARASVQSFENYVCLVSASISAGLF